MSGMVIRGREEGSGRKQKEKVSCHVGGSLGGPVIGSQEGREDCH